MAYFARKLRYGAHDGEAGANYMAFIELAKKKGGRSVCFVLYRRIIQYNYPAESRTEMIRLKAVTPIEAIEKYWPWEGEGEEEGKKFPGHRSILWKKTTLWLNLVAAGGAYERFGYDCGFGSKKIRYGEWVRVGTPAPWAKRRKKKPLQVGNPAHLVIVLQTRIEGLKGEKFDLECRLSRLEKYDEENDRNYDPPEGDEDYVEFACLTAEVVKVEEEIDSIETDIGNVKEEMRYRVRQMFPKPAGLPLKRLSRQKESRSRIW